MANIKAKRNQPSCIGKCSMTFEIKTIRHHFLLQFQHQVRLMRLWFPGCHSQWSKIQKKENICFI